MNISNILKMLKQKLYNRDVAIFLIFLLLALFVWFLNKLSHDYLYTTSYPIELYSTKDRQIIFDEKESVLTIQQRMDGFSIMKSKVSRTPTIRIDLTPDRYYKVQSTPNTYFTLTKNFTDIVDRQLGDDRQLVTINPDTLFFTIGVLAKKKVPVHHQLNVTTQKEYMLKDAVILSPDSITIAGSQEAIDGVSYVMGNPRSLVNLNEPVQGNFDLVPIKGIHFSENQIYYSADIIRYTEGYLKTTVKVLGLPSDINITLLPSEVELRYRASLSDFPSIDTSRFIASVNYKDISDGDDRTLSVQITQQPDKILSIHITPPFVEYIIRKN